jgi:hypothetical protein
MTEIRPGLTPASPWSTGDGVSQSYPLPGPLGHVDSAPSYLSSVTRGFLDRPSPPTILLARSCSTPAPWRPNHLSALNCSSTGSEVPHFARLGSENMPLDWIRPCGLCLRGLPQFRQVTSHMPKLSWLSQTAAGGCPLCALLYRCILRESGRCEPAEELKLVLIRNRRLMGFSFEVNGNEAKDYTAGPYLNFNITPLEGN